MIEILINDKGDIHKNNKTNDEKMEKSQSSYTKVTPVIDLSNKDGMVFVSNTIKQIKSSWEYRSFLKYLKCYDIYPFPISTTCIVSAIIQVCNDTPKIKCYGISTDMVSKMFVDHLIRGDFPFLLIYPDNDVMSLNKDTLDLALQTFITTSTISKPISDKVMRSLCVLSPTGLKTLGGLKEYFNRQDIFDSVEYKLFTHVMEQKGV